MKKTVQAMLLFIPAAFLVSCASMPSKPDTEINTEKNTVAKIIPINNPLPKGTLELIDGFEEENFWYALGETKSDDYSTDTDTTEEWNSQGDFCAQWSFAKIPENSKASFAIENLVQKDWTDAKALIADINNTCQNPLAILLETQGGPHHIVSRTQEILLGIGENINVYFDLLHEITDENGNQISGLIEKDDIRTISFQIKGKSFSGSVFVDNINLVY
ncbi:MULTISPECIES: hypothetical protein [Treponema]|uniref:Lipoprotein n=1 Tax=Treponema succinifaciens (strain ATCC 33096 / DSM 2489 / 6091) TaxID=869209 RepID=F2NSA0_TRES6|nr:hypothetical protein [Treponema succinifaciens]AEB14401.1 hypothetical protein Tresu_1501 [Treponema succinifaciens DSM 2489]MEE0353398.1 hypothetical protein [Treponema sp.]